MELRDLLASVANGSLKYFEAAEPLGALLELTPPGAATLRGVAIDHTVTVAHVLETVGLDEVPRSLDRATGGGTPTLLGNEGALLSGTTRRLFVIGGTVDGTKHGTPNTAGWMLDVDVNHWQEFPLPEAERPGAVLGATFRWQDAGVYLVDGKKSRPRLERWWPHRSVETLLTLPHAWKKYDRSWLVAGPGGDLVFAATKTAGGGKKKISGAQSLFYDRASGAHAAAPAAGSASHSNFRAAGRSAVGVCTTPGAPPAGCMWNGLTAETYPLVVPVETGASRAVPCIDSDGDKLVWMQSNGPADADGVWPDPWLHTSPYTTDPATVAPTKVRAAAPLARCSSAAGEGYFAMAGSTDWLYHVYRLSDGHHWSYSCHDMEPYIGMCLDVLLVDGNELWIQGASTIVRQRLDALGAGD